MFGPLILLVLFAVVHEPTRTFLEALLESVETQVALNAPVSYFLIFILLISALISAWLMNSRSPEANMRYRVVRRYSGPTSATPLQAADPPALGFRITRYAERWRTLVRRNRTAASLIRLFS